MRKDIIYGAIIGDIAGSTIERTYPDKEIDLEHLLNEGHFSDDTVLTIALLDAINTDLPIIDKFKEWGNKYPTQGFSKTFTDKFLKAERYEPVHSGTNGALMMLSPIIQLENTPLHRMFEAVRVTHSCYEAYACAEWYTNYGRNINSPVEHKLMEICPVKYFLINYNQLTQQRHWDMSSIITLRNALVCFKESESYKGCLVNALYLGGDADTTACVAGALAAKKFGVPEKYIELANKKLTGEMIKMLN